MSSRGVVAVVADETKMAEIELGAAAPDMERGKDSAPAAGANGTTNGTSTNGSNGNGGDVVAAGHHPGKTQPLWYRLWELVKVVLPAGCYAFGGPTAHLAVFQDLFVEKLHWLNEQEFVDLLALGKALPGPTSTEFCIAVGTYRAGVLGAIVTFAAWFLPSFVVMMAAGLGATHMEPGKMPDWMIGLAPASTVLIFVAFARLAKMVVDTPLKAAITLASTCVTVLVQDDPRLDPRSLMWVLPIMLVIGGSLTLGEKHLKVYRQRRQQQQQQAAAAAAAEGGEQPAAAAAAAASSVAEGAMGSAAVTSDTYSHVPVSRFASTMCFALVAGFLLFLLGLHLAGKAQSKGLHIFAAFFIVGVTIYGGGQVMLPLLVGISVEHGWLTMDQFLAGYALVQMLPGPLTNFAAFIGAIYMGVPGAFLGTLGFFLPGVLLVVGVLPYWDKLRKVPNVRPFLGGLNATGLGLILAVGIALALQVVRRPADAVVSVLTGGLVGFFGQSSVVGVLSGALTGFLMSPTCLDWGQQPYVSL